MRIAACLVALFVLFGAAASSAQGPPAPASLDALLGKPIAEVHLFLSGHPLEDPGVSGVLETRPGTALTATAVRQSLVHLMVMARFSDVTVDAQLTPRGVVLTYGLLPVSTVEAIEFRGDLGLPVRQLRSAVSDRFGTAPAAWRGDEIATMLEANFRDHGFLNATVKATTEPGHRENRLRLVFDVKAGQPAAVGEAHVEGAPDDIGAQVRTRLAITPGSRFDRLALDAAVRRYVEDLRSKGFLEASVEFDVVPAPDGKLVDVRVRMSRGPSETVTFRGDPFSDQRRKEILALLRAGRLDEDVLENQERSIENDLHAQGYRDAAAPFTREPGRNGQAQIVFTITRGRQYRVAGVDVAGDKQLPRAQIQPALRVAPGQWFVQSLVDADAGVIQGLYRRDGFRLADVKVNAAPAGHDSTQLQVTFTITEGPRTTIDAIAFEHTSAIPQAVLRQAVKSQVNGPFYQPQIDADRDDVLAQYQALGYLHADVTVPQAFSPDGTHFTLRFEVSEGPQILIDRVIIRGNYRTKAQTIERAVALQTGMPLTMVRLAEAQRRLSALGLFRTVQVAPYEGSGTRRDVLVTVEEAPVNTIGYGGGLEGTMVIRTNAQTGLPEQVFDVAPRGFFEIGRRNLWGKDRSVDLFLRGAIRSSDQFNPAASSTTNPVPGFHEYRVLATYREPRVADLPVDVVVSGNLEQAIRSTFDFNRRQVYVEGSHRISRKVSVAARYSFGRTQLFNEQIAPADQLNVDKVFPRVRLSSVSVSGILSTRDDAFDPTRGALVSLDATIAPRAIGSEVGFVKGTWQSFIYKRVPLLPGAVFAGGVRLGLAFGFPLVVVDATGQPVAIEQQLPASERFFAGGDTSVRGFAFDQLGARTVLDQNGVSNGGNGVVIANAELRFPLWRQKSIGGAVFIDTGNVFAKVSEINLGQLRSGAGVGIRWKSPVGPLRLDLAWKLSPITFGNGMRESRFAWYVTIGQAF
jgi:outer membrane protein insertion porin family